jgi:hypothetical protein
MTLNEIAESIATGLGKPTDIMLIERLKFTIKYWRARLLKQEVDKGNDNDMFLHRFIAPLKLVDQSDNCSVIAGCDILRTVDRIPNPIRKRGVKSYAYVGSANWKVRFEHCSIEDLHIKLASKYRKNVIYYDLIDGYGYVLNNTKLEWLGFKGVIGNLDLLKKYQCELTSNNICYNDDMDFPLPEDLVQFVINGILSNELKIVAKDDKEVQIEEE